MPTINKQILIDRLKENANWSEKEIQNFLRFLHQKGWLTNGSIEFPNEIDPAKVIKDFKEGKNC